jgi:hypothetical protein
MIQNWFGGEKNEAFAGKFEDLRGVWGALASRGRA